MKKRFEKNNFNWRSFFGNLAIFHKCGGKFRYFKQKRPFLRKTQTCSVGEFFSSVPIGDNFAIIWCQKTLAQEKTPRSNSSISESAYKRSFNLNRWFLFLCLICLIMAQKKIMISDKFWKIIFLVGFVTFIHLTQQNPLRFQFLIYCG